MSELWGEHPRGLEMTPPVRRLIPAVVIMIVGAGGIVGQILLLREFLVVAHGNELTMGIVLANWLILEAGGSLLGGRLSGGGKAPGGMGYAVLLAAFAAVLPAAIALARPAPRLLFGLVPGEAVGLGPLLASSLLLLAPVSAVHGALFPTACAWVGGLTGRRRAIGGVYLHETLGTLLGGAALTLVLAERFAPLTLGAGISVLHLLGAGAVLAVGGTSPRSMAGRVAAVGLLLCLCATIVLGAGTLGQRSLRWQWPDHAVAHYENTPYGNIVVLERAGEHTFLYDGRPVAVLPIPDMARIADYAHIVAASHPAPARVLLIGGGLGGLLDVLLQHPVQRVRYVELDPGMLSAIQRFPAEVTERELADPRVDIHHGDARRFLDRTDETYDLIVLGFLEPETLQTNRLFTREFFLSAGDNLAPDGIVALSLPGSPTQMSPQTADLNRSLARAAEAALGSVTLIAGETNILLASDAPPATDPETLAQRLLERDLDAGFVSASYLQYRLDPERQEWARAALRDSDARVNEDFNPAGLHYALAHWGRMFSPTVIRVLESLRNLHPAAVSVPPLFMAGAALFLGRRAIPGVAVKFAVFSTGVTGMAMDLLVLFLFQALYGFVYQMAGLLVACFMTGIWLGGRWAVARAEDADCAGIFSRADAGVALVPVAFYGCALLLRMIQGTVPDAVIFAVLATFAAAAGFLVGAQFPLAATLLSGGGQDAGRVAGSVYAADLFGGWFGGLAVSVVLFPVLGLAGTVSFLAALKLGSLLLGAVAPGTRPVRDERR